MLTTLFKAYHNQFHKFNMRDSYNHNSLSIKVLLDICSVPWLYDFTDFRTFDLFLSWNDNLILRWLKSCYFLRSVKPFPSTLHQNTLNLAVPRRNLATKALTVALLAKIS